MSITRGDIDYIDDEHTAARAWLELHHELAQPHTPHGRRTEAKAAMNKLERIYPEAPERAALASEDELGGLSPALKRTRDAHRKARGVTAQGARQARRSGGHGSAGTKTSGGGPARRPARTGARHARRARAAAGDFAEFTAPAAVDLAGLGWQVFGWGIGLSMAYLLLTNAQRAPAGKSAVELVAHGARHTVDALVSPLTDPLSPRRTR